MSFSFWAFSIGALLITMALTGTLVRQLPISMAMIYLIVGFGLGPSGLRLLNIDPFIDSVLLQHLAEASVLISLFAVGLKLGVPLNHKRWRLPLRLALVSMTVTVALIALIAVFGFGLSWGGAILLAAILAPTDPVLASDVQVVQVMDRDRIRFSLTGEGGLNDGTAFPFVMLGLGLLGLHDLGEYGWRWLVIDVLWAVVGGLLIGAALGALIGRLVVHLRSRHRESVLLDEFLALGLIALTYGAAALSMSSGFLAVFAAGLALQRVQSDPVVHDGGPEITPIREVPPVALAGEAVPAAAASSVSAYMHQEVRVFNDQLERVAEVALVLIVGAMISYAYVQATASWLAFLLLFLVRPVSVWFGLLGAEASGDQRMLISWFGIRGVGSIYYLMFALNKGVPVALAELFISITLTVVTLSIVLHGISVTPLMGAYATRKGRRRPF
jgi:NhaP-type Na+/H+ or K+/H+ antiporter